MEQLEVFNRSLFLIINAAPDTPLWRIGDAIWVANGLIFMIPALLLGLWLWGGAVRREIALKACLVAFVGVGMNQIIGLMWSHPRPFMIGLGHTWMAHAADSSFPSDHFTVFGAVGLSLLLGGMTRIGTLCLVAGLAVAWSRVFLGVHFPLDMVGAFGVAGMSYALIASIWQIGGSRVTALAVQVYRGVMARPIAWGWLRP